MTSAPAPVLHPGFLRQRAEPLLRQLAPGGVPSTIGHGYIVRIGERVARERTSPWFVPEYARPENEAALLHGLLVHVESEQWDDFRIGGLFDWWSDRSVYAAFREVDHSGPIAAIERLALSEIRRDPGPFSEWMAATPAAGRLPEAPRLSFHGLAGQARYALALGRPDIMNVINVLSFADVPGDAVARALIAAGPVLAGDIGRTADALPRWLWADVGLEPPWALRDLDWLPDHTFDLLVAKAPRVALALNRARTLQHSSMDTARRRVLTAELLASADPAEREAGVRLALEP